MFIATTEVTMPLNIIVLKDDGTTKRIGHEFRMVILKEFPNLTLEFELGIPVKVTSSKKEAGKKRGSYVDYEYQTLLTVEFDMAYKPTVTTSKRLDSQALFEFLVLGKPIVVEGTYYNALKFVWKVWETQFQEGIGEANNWSTWYLVALKLLPQMIAAEDTSTVTANEIKSASASYKILTKDVVWATIVDAYVQLTDRKFAVTDSHKTIATGIQKLLTSQATVQQVVPAGTPNVKPTK